MSDDSKVTETVLAGDTPVPIFDNGKAEALNKELKHIQIVRPTHAEMLAAIESFLKGIAPVDCADNVTGDLDQALFYAKVLQSEPVPAVPERTLPPLDVTTLYPRWHRLWMPTKEELEYRERQLLAFNAELIAERKKRESAETLVRELRNALLSIATDFNMTRMIMESQAARDDAGEIVQCARKLVSKADDALSHAKKVQQKEEQ
jgi:hypothetical protein